MDPHLPNFKFCSPCAYISLTAPAYKATPLSSHPKPLVLGKGISAGRDVHRCGSRGSTLKVSLLGHWCLRELCRVCLGKEAKGDVFLLHTSKVRSAERWGGQVSTWGTMSCSSMYVFIAVSWRASAVSHLGGLVQRGRPQLGPELKEIYSSTITSKPVKGGKRSVLWEGLQQCLIIQTVIWWPSRVLFCRCLLLLSVLHGWSSGWILPRLLAPSGAAVPALPFSAINCNYPLFSYHLKLSTLSCDFKPRSFC